MDRYKAGEFSFGCLFMDRNVIGMQGLAKADYTYVIIDFMYGWIGWDDAHHMCLAARDAGLTPIIRLQSYPWRDKVRRAPDERILVDAARAAALGAEGVMVSVDSVAETEYLAEVARDWHRAGHLQTSTEELAGHESEIRQQLIVMPGVESMGGLDELEGILDVEGINAFMISGSDLPRQLGYPWEYEHPEVWRYVDRAVELCQKKSIPIGMNSGWIYVERDESVDRIKRMRDHGLNFALTQTGYHMLYASAKGLVDGVRSE